MRATWKTELPQLTLIAAMFVLAAIWWPSIPDQVPVHWGLSGQPNRYGGKFEGLLLLPLVAFGLYLLLLFLPRMDPLRTTYARFGRVYLALRIVLLVFFALIYGSVLFSIGGVLPSGLALVPILVGGLFVVIGILLAVNTICVVARRRFGTA